MADRLYQGPIKPGTSEEYFRLTGKSINIPSTISTGWDPDVYYEPPEQQLVSTKEGVKTHEEVYPETTTTTTQTTTEPTPQPKTIEPYQETKPKFIDKKDSVIKRFGRSVAGSYRQFINEPRPDDETLGDFFKITTDFSDQPVVLPYQERGTISDAPKLTRGEFYEQERLATGGYQPTEFILGDIAKDIQKGAETELGTKRDVIQEQITTGKISYDFGVEELEKNRQEIEKQMQQSYEKRGGEFLARRGLAESFKPQVTTDLLTPLKLGGLVAGSLVAPVPTGMVMAGLGGKEAITGFGKATLGGEAGLGFKERLVSAGTGTLGLIGVGLGTSISFKGIEKSIISGELLEHSKQPVKFAGLRFKGDKFDLDVLHGVKQSGGLRTEAQMFGKTYKIGDRVFFQPQGYGQSLTAGRLDWSLAGTGQGTKVIGFQKFNVGQMGFSFKLGDSSRLWFGSVGKGYLQPKFGGSVLFDKESRATIFKQLGRSIKTTGKVERDFFGGVTYRQKPDFFFTRGGKISDWKMSPFGDKHLISFNARDVGAIKVIDTRRFGNIIKGGYKVGGTQLKTTGTTAISQQQLGRGMQLSTQQISKNIQKSFIGKGFGGGLASVQKTKQDTLTRSMQLPKLSYKQLQLPRQRSLLAFAPAYKQKTGLSERQMYNQFVGTKLKTQQLQKQVLGDMGRGFNFPSTPIYPKLRWKPFFPFMLPPLMPLGFSARRTKGKRGKRQYHYQPSIVSLAFDIKAPKPPKLYGTGLVLRPILSGKRKKKRRVKKRK